MSVRRARVRRGIVPVPAVALVVVGQGCLERYIVVTSDPPGAIVELNGEEVGRTPTRTAFTYYGVYDLRLSREGFEPVHDRLDASQAPPWDWPGLDLIAELLPVPFSHTVERHVELAPSDAASNEPGALAERAEAMRRRALRIAEEESRVEP